MSILDQILAHKRGEVDRRRRAVPLEVLQSAALEAVPARGLRECLSRSDRGVRIIAEVKRASPSRGLIREDFDPVAIARGYERGGAAGISVLTDEKYFRGSLESLRAIRAWVDVPLLRKDFIIDPYQVVEARAAGADAVLLILAALSDEQCGALWSESERLGMDVLWEVHDAGELERLLPLAPRLVGINNRDLKTFRVSLDTTRSLAPRAREAGALVVSESGFSRPEELSRMLDWGADAFLIGESLMRAEDPGLALENLIAATRPPGGESS